MAFSRPVLIAGGGIGGLTAAIALELEGIVTRVFERSTFTEESGAGIQLTPNATRILRTLGVLDQLIPASFKPEAVCLFDGRSGQKVTTVPLGDTAEERYGAPYLTVHRADLHRVLRSLASERSGISLTPSFTISGVNTGGPENDVTITNIQGESISGPILIGADGIWSTIRKHLVPRAIPAFTGATAFRTMMPIRNLPAPFAEPVVGLWLGANTHLVHYPVRGGEALNIVAVSESGQASEGWNRWVDRRTVLSAFSQWCQPVLDLMNSAESWRAWSLHLLSPLPSWHQGNTVLLGDAAHPVLPYLAQGAALAIEDAARLAGLLDAAQDQPQLAFRSYEKIRRARAIRVQRTSQRFGRAYHAGSTILGDLFRLSRNCVLSLRDEETTLRGFDWLYGYGTNLEDA